MALRFPTTMVAKRMAAPRSPSPEYM
jgi:hypothetical protein